MGKIIKEEDKEQKNLNINSKKMLQNLEAKLKNFGYKFTGPRRKILEILAGKNDLFDTDSIYLTVKKKDPSIGIATVYRTLELLTRLNLICKINIGLEKSMYMLSENCTKQTSVYMICEKCKTVITNNDCLKNAIKIRLKENAEQNILDNCNLKIDKFQIVFSGLCEKCIKT